MIVKRKISEKDIQKSIIEYLEILQKTKKIWFKRTNQGAFKTESGGYFKATSINGVPDIEVILEGIYIGLEVKTATGRLNKNQIETHRKIISAGGLVYVVRSLKDVQSIFEVKK